MVKKVPSPIGAVSILRYPTGLPTDNFSGLSTKNNMKTTFEGYPLELEFVEDQSVLRLRCIGAPIAQESLGWLIRTWIIRLINSQHRNAFPRPAVVTPEFYSLTLKVGDQIFENISPVSGKPDKRGFYEFEVKQVEVV